jgi:16S rRNA (guanine(527)-N(7))-methyltransferase RsmG
LTPRPHAAALAGLHLETPVAESLETFLDLLALWSRRVNLTGAQTPEERVRVLVEDALLAAPDLGAGRLIDVGSGNGSPGLVLALARPDLRVVLLEPRQKRWTFLREAARVLVRPDIEVVRGKAESYDGGEAENASLRGLAIPLETLAPLLKPGGRVFVFGGSPKASPSFDAAGTRRLATLTLHTFSRGVSRETVDGGGCNL